MKRWVLTGLGAASVLLWTSVFAVCLSQDTSVGANLHSTSMLSTVTQKSTNEKRLASHFQFGDNGEQETEKIGSSFIIGTENLSEKWIEDVSEDGKLSIDTLLDVLDSKDNEYK